MSINDDADRITMSQPFLLNRIIQLLEDENGGMNIKDTPIVHREILHKDEKGPSRKESCNYRSAIGMLNYLVVSTRPDILFVITPSTKNTCAIIYSNTSMYKILSQSTSIV